MRRRRRGHSLRRRYGLARHVPGISRAQMIEALGLEAESRKRSLSGHMTDRYAATTAEFWQKILHGTAPAHREARRRLGIKEP